MEDDRRLDAPCRERINEIHKECTEGIAAMQEEYEVFAHKSYRIQKWQFICIAVLAIVSFYFFHVARDQRNDIQNQRKDAIFRSCDDQNLRNATTISVLDARLGELRRAGKLTKKQIKDLEASRTFTVLLIDALAPTRNCKQLVEQFT